MEEDEHRMVGQFSQLRVFAIPPIPAQVRKSLPGNETRKFLSGNETRKSLSVSEIRKCLPNSSKMDGLAQDLNSALEESTRSSTSSASSKRKFLRRRCKSTCNLSTTGASTNPGAAAASQQSDDSSTSSLEDNVGVCVSSRGERGTSSLQLTDSDENSAMVVISTATTATTTSTTAAASRKKRSESWNSARTSVPANESDSHNENVSPVRPNTKRKRKFKRMAIDPAVSSASSVALTNTSPLSSCSSAIRVSLEPSPATPSGTIKRKKVRSKSAVCEKSSSSSGVPDVSSNRLSSPKTTFTPSVRQRQSSGVVPGKRKRSTREKSVETDLSQKTNTFLLTGKETKDLSMDCDDERQSSSSLSSTEWEDQEDSGGDDDECQSFGRDDEEADDEQSDWHDSGPAPPGTVYLLTDDEDSSDMPMSLFAHEGASNEMQIENFNKLTSTARQAYLARMKRLAECVPGREIRAGTRRIRTRQSGFTIKSASSEQLSRFLQDPARTQLRLSVLRGSDRSKIVHLANLYSLSLRYEEPHMLVLSKTGKTVKVDEFLVPKTPTVKQPVEVKRRRRTPPPSLTDDFDADNIGMEEEEEEEPDENFDKEFSQNIIFVEQNQQRDDSTTSLLNVAFEACST